MAIGNGENGNGSNVMNLRFPLQIVAAIVAACLSSALTILATNYSMRSDIRDLSTRQTFYEKGQDELKVRVEKENLELKQTIENNQRAVLGKLEMISIRSEELQLTLASKGITRDPIR